MILKSSSIIIIIIIIIIIVEIYRILGLNFSCYCALLASIANQIRVSDRRPLASRFGTARAAVGGVPPASHQRAFPFLPKTWITADHPHRGNSRVEL